MTPPRLSLLISLDVEEEGLFGGRYQRRGCTTANTASLGRIAPLCARGAQFTLFCAHSVLADAASCATLARLRDTHGVEIGAHLHHWNTPPLTWPPTGASADATAGPDSTTSVPADALSPSLLAAKLECLLEAARNGLGERPTSFRMGRWDAHRALWPLLARAGFLADASVRPLHRGRPRRGSAPASGPDHFDAPAAPYWIPVDAEHRLFEAPLTVTPLHPHLPGLVRRLPGPCADAALTGFQHWGALALLPVYHPLWVMKLVTRLYVQRGGRLLSLTWHSSEMHPGATPHLPDAKAVDGLLGKITAWLDWLMEHFDVRCRTLDALRRELGPTAPVLAGNGDWSMDEAAGPCPQP